jgi:hypothetical protein
MAIMNHDPNTRQLSRNPDLFQKLTRGNFARGEARRQNLCLIISFWTHLDPLETQISVHRDRSTTANMRETTSEAALARKRRMELRTASTSTTKKPRLATEEELVVVDPVSSASTSDKKNSNEKPKPHITGIKKQSRYDPGVPMNRQELREWRKEARKVRNRQSAAESRKRNRERITELEGEVDVLQSKYSAALQRIVELEAAAAAGNASSFTPATLRQDISNLGLTKAKRSAAAAPKMMMVSDPAKTISPPLSPIASFEAGPMDDGKRDHEEHVQKKYQHIMDMISRPIA